MTEKRYPMEITPFASIATGVITPFVATIVNYPDHTISSFANDIGMVISLFLILMSHSVIVEFFLAFIVIAFSACYVYVFLLISMPDEIGLKFGFHYYYSNLFNIALVYILSITVIAILRKRSRHPR